jgi:hypothetical protein
MRFSFKPLILAGLVALLAGLGGYRLAPATTTTITLTKTLTTTVTVTESLAEAPRGPLAEATYKGILRLRVELDRAIYRRHDALEAHFTLTNTGREALTLIYTSTQRFDFELAGGGKTILWSGDKAFAQVVAEITLKPGESIVQTLDLKLTVPAGDYTLTGWADFRLQEGQKTLQVRLSTPPIALKVAA